MNVTRDIIQGDFDVVIIGGGPAGCATALHLMRLAPEIAQRSVLLEKSFHPREKVCGGALTINAENLLAELGIEVTCPYYPIHHTCFSYGHLDIDLAEDGVAKKVIRRSDFDAMLMQIVKDRDFKVAEGVKVTGVTRQSNHVLIHTTKGEYRARAVVGADGVGALLRNKHGFGERGGVSRLWLVETPVDPEKHHVFREHVMQVDLSYVNRGIKGYYWEFPSYIDGQPYVNQGLVDSSLDYKNRVDGKKLLCEILAERGVSLEDRKIKCHPMRKFNPREVYSQPNMLLAGDSIGVDPLFCEGISQALSHGRLAAYEICAGFRRNDLSFSGFTKRVLKSRVGREMRLFAKMNTLAWPFLEPFLSSLYSDMQIRDLLAYSYAGKKDMSSHMFLLLKLSIKHLLLLGPRLRKFRRDAGLVPHKLSWFEKIKIPGRKRPVDSYGVAYESDKSRQTGILLRRGEGDRVS
ncbi:MAG: NAD(P)/FAD-dependent oxidoreductase [Planctomycetota bacterium]|jgi:flavin-dependent dehydrogenase